MNQKYRCLYKPIGYYKFKEREKRMERALKLATVVILGAMLLSGITDGIRHINEKISNVMEQANDAGKIRIDRKVNPQ